MFSRVSQQYENYLASQLLEAVSDRMTQELAACFGHPNHVVSSCEARSCGLILFPVACCIRVGVTSFFEK
jgi:hypothetical protein